MSTSIDGIALGLFDEALESFACFYPFDNMPDRPDDLRELLLFLNTAISALAVLMHGLFDSDTTDPQPTGPQEEAA